MGFGMAVQMAGPAGADMPKAFRKLPGILGKLVPVAKKLNFFKSEASFTIKKEAGYLTRHVSNYREPPKEKGDGEDWGDDWGDSKKSKESNSHDDKDN